MYIGGIDIGTSGCKITLYDDNGTYICNCYEEYDVRRENGEQELDGAQLLKSVFSVIKSAALYALRSQGITRPCGNRRYKFW